MRNVVYSGGCAVMLDLDVYPGDYAQASLDEAEVWGCLAQTGHDLHCTLQFVGRDLTAARVAAVINRAFDLDPVTLKLTGRLEAWSTPKGRYLVALVEPTPTLLQRRADLRWRLPWEIRDDFGEWRPHVTLVEASPGLVTDQARWCSPIEITCTRATVKYGRHRMTIEL